MVPMPPSPRLWGKRQAGEPRRHTNCHYRYYNTKQGKLKERSPHSSRSFANPHSFAGPPPGFFPVGRCFLQRKSLY